MNDIEMKIYEAYGIDPKLLEGTSAASIITMADEQYKEFIENNKVMIGVDLGMDKDITVIDTKVISNA